MPVDRTYRSDLADLEAFAGTIPNTRHGIVSKVTALATMNLRWEPVMLDRSLAEHPFQIVHRLIADARAQMAQWQEASYASNPEIVSFDPPPMESRHHELFQALWTEFSGAEYDDRIERYEHRLRINGLADGFLDGRRVIDFGCGHGNFAHALRRAGADHVLGIDFGEASIEYAKAACTALGEDRIAFRVATVYDTGEEDASFDFAVQNGVFHHLDDEARAYREMLRVLKPGGWAWIYTDGADSVCGELWDASARILSSCPASVVLGVLDALGLDTGKRYHLGDSLQAVYRHDTWEGLTGRLAALGFGEFRRLIGGFPTDFDHDVITADPWGEEKFGTGDLRLLAMKL